MSAATMTLADLQLLRAFARQSEHRRVFSADEIIRVRDLRNARRREGLTLDPTDDELRLAADAHVADDCASECVPWIVTAPDGDPTVLEKAEQHACVKLYRAFGCVVYSTSQARASRVSEGIPDLWIFAPRQHRAVWHEVKRPVGGELSPAQEEFAEFAQNCHVPLIIGDRSAAARWLLASGAATREQLLDCGEGITAAMLDFALVA